LKASPQDTTLRDLVVKILEENLTAGAGAAEEALARYPLTLPTTWAGRMAKPQVGTTLSVP